MKRIGIALALFVALIIAVGYNVWRANQEPVTTPPSLVEVGRQQLHAQLEQAQRTEAQIEKQDWDSPLLLEEVIKAHQQRIDKLKDNSQAGEILAHDREAIDRLQKRIAELHAKAEAQAALADATPPAAEANATAQQPANNAASAAPATAKPAPKAPAPKSTAPTATSPRP